MPVPRSVAGSPTAAPRHRSSGHARRRRWLAVPAVLIVATLSVVFAEPASALTQIGSIPVPAEITGLPITGDGATLFATDFSNDEVDVVSTASNSVVQTWATGRAASRARFVPR